MTQGHAGTRAEPGSPPARCSAGTQAARHRAAVGP